MITCCFLLMSAEFFDKNATSFGTTLSRIKIGTATYSAILRITTHARQIIQRSFGWESMANQIRNNLLSLVFWIWVFISSRLNFALLFIAIGRNVSGKKRKVGKNLSFYFTERQVLIKYMSISIDESIE
mmetsp:Transcript_32628/g.75104  ORF Transcript_32628/g.75104 Transcript_32628/m.75104 type:complete len:129 (+) Transcript_32628:102-488(+)